MTVLDLLAANHNEWLKMAHKFGAGDYAEDIVQEMYIPSPNTPNLSLIHI